MKLACVSSLLFLAGFAGLFCWAGAAECHGAPSPKAQPNMREIYDKEPELVKTVTYGTLFTVGEEEDAVDIVHVWGTPYQMGYAHGQLQQKKAQGFINNVWTYLEEQVVEAINSTVHIFKPFFLEDVANFGLEVALEMEVLATRPFSGKHFEEELQGLADATGLPFKKLLYIHMMGELTKGGCSMMGAWGDALQESEALLQLRALDWDVDGPFKDYPQITVYHPQGKPEVVGRAFANVGWTGWIGSITGINSQRVAISEIGVTFPDSTFGKESRFGNPFTYLLRDILQFDASLDDAINRLANTQRTCDLILGVGDGKQHLSGFRGVQYSASVARFFDDTNLEPTADWHPKIKDVVYWGMDWLCPNYSEVLARQIKSLYGKLTPESVIRYVTPIVQTGDLHIAIYDLTGDFLYVANARSSYESGPPMAYDRNFIKLNTTTLFAQPPPNV